MKEKTSKKKPRSYTETDLIDAYIHGYNDCLNKKKVSFNKYLIEHHGIDHLGPKFAEVEKPHKKKSRV